MNLTDIPKSLVITNHITTHFAILCRSPIELIVVNFIPDLYVNLCLFHHIFFSIYLLRASFRALHCFNFSPLVPTIFSLGWLIYHRYPDLFWKVNNDLVLRPGSRNQDRKASSVSLLKAALFSDIVLKDIKMRLTSTKKCLFYSSERGNLTGRSTCLSSRPLGRWVDLLANRLTSSSSRILDAWFGTYVCCQARDSFRRLLNGEPVVEAEGMKSMLTTVIG